MLTQIISKIGDATLTIKTNSLATLCILGFVVTLSINKKNHNVIHHNVSFLFWYLVSES